MKNSLYILIMCALNCPASAQPDSTRPPTMTNFGPQIEGIQLAYLLPVPSEVVQADVDFNGFELVNNDNTHFSLGIRTGVDLITQRSSLEPSGDTYVDYDLLGRFTLHAKVVRINVLTGYTHRTYSYKNVSTTWDLVKFGIDAECLLIAQTVGLTIEMRFTSTAQKKFTRFMVGPIIYFDI